MAGEPHVVGLENCTGDCAQLVGGKATGLGALLREGLQVPPGFAITTAAYREHVARTGLATQLERLLADCTTYEAQLRAAEEIRNLFEASSLSPELAEEVLRVHAELCQPAETPVAVRSSASAEDMGDASFAGQQETYLWILGGSEVLRHVVRCWASLFTPQAIAYRAHLRTPLTDLAMGVVVQRMVPAEAAGVMLTIDPVTGDRSAIVIEAAYGLGAAVVNGEVNPDRVCVDKELLEIRSRSIGIKTVGYRFDPLTQGIRLEDVPRELQNKPCLRDAEIIELARLGKRMEQALGGSQDIEWAIGPGAGGTREVFLVQCRPETVWSQKALANT
jgi:phosphoenolpyruvate synthase/pyruvate phosphate dikinase